MSSSLQIAEKSFGVADWGGDR